MDIACALLAVKNFLGKDQDIYTTDTLSAANISKQGMTKETVSLNVIPAIPIMKESMARLP